MKKQLRKPSRMRWHLSRWRATILTNRTKSGAVNCSARRSLWRNILLWSRKKREYLLAEQPMPPQFFHARTLRDVGNQLFKTAYPIRIALDKSVDELCRGGFFFLLLVLKVLRILCGGRVFLDDTGDQVLLLFGGRGVVYACRELLNTLASAHVLHQVARSGGVSDVPTCKNNLRHAMIFDTDRLHQR